MDDVRRRFDRDLTRVEWELYVGNEPYAETRVSTSTHLRTVAAQRAPEDRGVAGYASPDAHDFY